MEQWVGASPGKPEHLCVRFILSRGLRAHSQLSLPLMTFLEGEDLIESIDVDPQGSIFSVLLSKLGRQVLLMRTGDVYIQFLTLRVASTSHNFRELCLKDYAMIGKSLVMKQCLSCGKSFVLMLNLSL